MESQIDWFKVFDIVNNQGRLQLNQQDFSIQQLGGLSNFIYKITCNKDYEKQFEIVYKIFSFYFTCLNNRERENIISQQISQQGLGPKIYYSNNHQRIEEFWQFEKITTDQMSKDQVMYRRLAQVLGQFHKACDYNEKLEANFMSHIDNDNVYQCVKQSINNTNKLDQAKKDELLTIAMDIFSKKMKVKFKQLLQMTTGVKVFAHNDLNNTNLLFNKNSNQLYLIDYEYTGFNYRCYEFGNLFNEMTWNYDYNQPPFFQIKPELYPTQEMQIDFFAHYVYSYKKIQSNQQCQNMEILNKNVEELTSIVENKLEFQQEIKKLMQEANIGRIFSHTFWLIVGILSLSYTELDIDLYSYIKIRYEQIYQHINVYIQ